jgi:hypothetical protein
MVLRHTFASLLVLVLLGCARAPTRPPDEWFEAETRESRLLQLTTARLGEGVDVNTLWLDTPFGQAGITWLMSAAARGFERVVDLVLANGANTTATNAWGFNALHFAAAGGSERVVRRLLLTDLSATQPSAGPGTPHTPIDLARQYGHADALERLVARRPPPPSPPMIVASAHEDPWFHDATLSVRDATRT